MPLSELFPDGDYRFHLTLRRAEPREYFAPQDPGGGVLAERSRWLDAEPGRHAALLPGGEPLVEEFAQLVREWGVVAANAPSSLLSSLEHARGYDLLQALGRALEPDILFLSPDAEGKFRLRAGALCFPTGWALEEKLGHPLDVIHGVVPGLNAALGASIQQFLAKLKPGPVFLRDNWGIAATDELNLHPARAVPPPAPPVALDRLWLRVEHQALLALPRTRGLVFGIRIALHRLDIVARDPAAPRLRHALATMPPQLLGYKRLDTVRSRIIELLGM
jgi:hypothetical protein